LYGLLLFEKSCLPRVRRKLKVFWKSLGCQPRDVLAMANSMGLGALRFFPKSAWVSVPRHFINPKDIKCRPFFAAEKKMGCEKNNKSG